MRLVSRLSLLFVLGLGSLQACGDASSEPSSVEPAQSTDESNQGGKALSAGKGGASSGAVGGASMAASGATAAGASAQGGMAAAGASAAGSGGAAMAGAPGTGGGGVAGAPGVGGAAGVSAQGGAGGAGASGQGGGLSGMAGGGGAATAGASGQGGDGGAGGQGGDAGQGGAVGQGGAGQAGAGGGEGVAWLPGALGSSPPSAAELLALPGGGEGPPVFTSNNPESFTGVGYLYQTARESPSRGGGPFALEGKIGVYLHHLNKSGAKRFLQIVVTNPGGADVTVSAKGSGYNQTETGGLGFGYGPDYQVAEDWLTQQYQTVVAPAALAPKKPRQIFVKPINAGAEIDGRFEIEASGPVYVYCSVTDTESVNDVITLSQTEAPGDIAKPGAVPPPFGREAGVYAHDRWVGAWSLEVPEAGQHVGYLVNTANGAGQIQNQAFPALTHFSDSSKESVGNYGNVYDLRVKLRSPQTAPGPRKVRVVWAGNVKPDASISFQWNGPGRVDGQVVSLLLTPKAPMQELATYTLQPGEERELRFEAPVPGLTSIFQMLLFESI